MVTRALWMLHQPAYAGRSPGPSENAFRAVRSLRLAGKEPGGKRGEVQAEERSAVGCLLRLPCLTFLPRSLIHATLVAYAWRLEKLARGHWGIENGLHYRRDVTMGEDASHAGSA